ncbi:GIN domain-containing protein [Fibrisoma montanum]|nr:DUF2807 domain-containing protein [Fibrisoma montanum]
MKPVFISLFLLLSFATYAQNSKYDASKELRGNGRIVRETKTLQPFEVIEIEQFPADLTIEAGATTSSLTISLDENLRSYLQISNENGKLKLAFKDPAGKPFWISKATVNVSIKTPRLKQLKNGWSNSDIRVTGLAGESFDLVNEANADITLRGKVNTFDLVSSANGTIDADQLVVKTANVVTQANATVRINAQTVNEVKSGHANLVNVSTRPK